MNNDYIPTEWENGDIITATKMNHIEQGIANINNNALIGEATDFDEMNFPNRILMTGTESWEALKNGKPVLVHYRLAFYDENEEILNSLREEYVVIDHIVKSLSSTEGCEFDYEIGIPVNQQHWEYKATDDGYYVSPYFNS